MLESCTMNREGSDPSRESLCPVWPFFWVRRDIFMSTRGPLSPLCRDPVVEMLAKMGRRVKISPHYPHPESKSFRNTCLPQGRPIDSKRGWIFENEKSTQVICWLDLKITCTFEMLYHGGPKGAFGRFPIHYYRLESDRPSCLWRVSQYSTAVVNTSDKCIDKIRFNMNKWRLKLEEEWCIYP